MVGCPEKSAPIVALADEVRLHFPVSIARMKRLSTPVNDVFVVETSTGRFALKLYHSKRTLEQVQWEVDLLLHLRHRHAPVVAPVPGRHGQVEVLTVGEASRVAVLYEWAPGEKPSPTPAVYGLLGAAAARVHAAADSFRSSLPREEHDTRVLIDEQLERMKEQLCQAALWKEAVALGTRLSRFLSNARLERGICHMDLTLDNVHVNGDDLTVFDFDSACRCWRAIEPYGVLRHSTASFQAWLTGYRSVRPFARAEEQAVPAFAIIGELRATSWKLGVADSSRGAPVLSPADLPGILDQWLRWEQTHL
jgi:Ser/Thr protein kinase RdoA (MazF antagonist)